MNKFIYTVAIIATSIIAKAEEVCDTTIVYNGHTVTITDDSLNNGNDGESSYQTEYEEWTIMESFNLPFINLINSNKDNSSEINKHINKFQSHICGFNVGFTNALNTAENFNTNMGRSVELGFIFCEQAIPFSINTGLTFGLGFNWRNYKIDDNCWMRKNGGFVTVEKLPEGYDLKYSKLRVFSINLPMVFELQQKSGNGFYGYVGTQADFRLARRVVNKYSDEDGNSRKNTAKHVRTLPVGCDLIAQIGCKDIAIYGKYSITSLFEDGRGPIGKAITVGARLMF